MGKYPICHSNSSYCPFHLPKKLKQISINAINKSKHAIYILNVCSFTVINYSISEHLTVITKCSDLTINTLRICLLNSMCFTINGFENRAFCASWLFFFLFCLFLVSNVKKVIPDSKFILTLLSKKKSEIYCNIWKAVAFGV